MPRKHWSQTKTITTEHVRKFRDAAAEAGDEKAYRDADACCLGGDHTTRRGAWSRTEASIREAWAQLKEDPEQRDPWEDKPVRKNPPKRAARGRFFVDGEPLR